MHARRHLSITTHDRSGSSFRLFQRVQDRLCVVACDRGDEPLYSTSVGVAVTEGRRTRDEGLEVSKRGRRTRVELQGDRRGRLLLMHRESCGRSKIYKDAIPIRRDEGESGRLFPLIARTNWSTGYLIKSLVLAYKRATVRADPLLSLASSERAERSPGQRVKKDAGATMTDECQNARQATTVVVRPTKRSEEDRARNDLCISVPPLLFIPFSYRSSLRK